MGRDPNKGCDFAKGQKIRCIEAIIKLNLSCNFSNLSVSVSEPSSESLHQGGFTFVPGGA